MRPSLFLLYATSAAAGLSVGAVLAGSGSGSSGSITMGSSTATAISGPLSLAPMRIQYSGRFYNTLSNPKVAVANSKTNTIVFEIFDAPTGGTSLYGPEIQTVSSTDGHVSAVIGSVTPMTPAQALAIAQAGKAYLQVTFDSEGPALGLAAEVFPRTELTSSLFAIHSVFATDVPGANITPNSVDTTGQGTPSNSVRTGNLLVDGQANLTSVNISNLNVSGNSILNGNVTFANNPIFQGGLTVGGITFHSSNSAPGTSDTADATQILDFTVGPASISISDGTAANNVLTIGDNVNDQLILNGVGQSGPGVTINGDFGSGTDISIVDNEGNGMFIDDEGTLDGGTRIVGNTGISLEGTIMNQFGPVTVTDADGINLQSGAGAVTITGTTFDVQSTSGIGNGAALAKLRLSDADGIDIDTVGGVSLNFGTTLSVSGATTQIGAIDLQAGIANSTGADGGRLQFTDAQGAHFSGPVEIDGALQQDGAITFNNTVDFTGAFTTTFADATTLTINSGITTIGNAAGDALTVNATSSFNNPVNFANAATITANSDQIDLGNGNGDLNVNTTTFDINGGTTTFADATTFTVNSGTMNLGNGGGDDLNVTVSTFDILTGTTTFADGTTLTANSSTMNLGNGGADDLNVNVTTFDVLGGTTTFADGATITANSNTINLGNGDGTLTTNMTLNVNGAFTSTFANANTLQVNSDVMNFGNGDGDLNINVTTLDILGGTVTYADATNFVVNSNSITLSDDATDVVKIAGVISNGNTATGGGAAGVDPVQIDDSLWVAGRMVVHSSVFPAGGVDTSDAAPALPGSNAQVPAFAVLGTVHINDDPVNGLGGLRVSGSITTGENIILNAGNIQNTGATVTINDNLDVEGGIEGNSLDLNGGAITDTGSINVTNNITAGSLTVTTTGSFGTNLTVGGTLGVTGQITGNNGLNITSNGATIVGATTITGATNITGATGVVGAFTQSGGANTFGGTVTINNTLTVGAFTTSLGGNLDVAGAVSTPGGAPFQINDDLQVNGTSDLRQQIQNLGALNNGRVFVSDVDGFATSSTTPSLFQAAVTVGAVGTPVTTTLNGAFTVGNNAAQFANSTLNGSVTITGDTAAAGGSSIFTVGSLATTQANVPSIFNGNVTANQNVTIGDNVNSPANDTLQVNSAVINLGDAAADTMTVNASTTFVDTAALTIQSNVVTTMDDVGDTWAFASGTITHSDANTVVMNSNSITLGNAGTDALAINASTTLSNAATLVVNSDAATIGNASTDTLTVNSTTTFVNNVTINGDLTENGGTNALSVNGDVTVTGGTTTFSDTTTFVVNSNTQTLGNASTDVLTVNATTTHNAPTTFANAATLTVNSDVATIGNANSDTLGIQSATTFTGTSVTLNNTAALTVNSDVALIGNANTDTLGIQSATTFTGTAVTLNNSATFTVNSDSQTLGNASTDVLTVNATTTHNAPVTLANAATFTVNSDVTTIGNAPTDTLTINATTVQNGPTTFADAATLTINSNIVNAMDDAGDVWNFLAGTLTHADGTTLIVNSTTMVLGNASTDSLTIGATTAINAPTTFANAATLVINSDSTTIGNASTDGLTVNATSTFNANVTDNANLTVNGNTTIGDASSDSLTVNAASTFNANVVANANVTIGNSPTDVLQINSGTAIGNNGTGFGPGNFLAGNVLSVWGNTSIAGTMAMRRATNGAQTMTFDGETGKITAQALSITGQKNFITPNPADARTEFVYVAQEGPEAGVYFRGQVKVTKGETRIELPESFALVTEKEGLTANVTAFGKKASVWVVDQAPNYIVIGSDEEVTVNYRVDGVRMGFADHQAKQINRHFLPRTKAQVDVLPTGVIELLKKNGTVNADGTPNLELINKIEAGK